MLLPFTAATFTNRHDSLYLYILPFGYAQLTRITGLP